MDDLSDEYWQVVPFISLPLTSRVFSTFFYYSVFILHDVPIFHFQVLLFDVPLLFNFWQIHYHLTLFTPQYLSLFLDTCAASFIDHRCPQMLEHPLRRDSQMLDRFGMGWPTFLFSDTI